LLNKSEGFTLIELAVVMMIVSVLAMLTTPNIMNEINQKRANIAVEETQLIVDAARSFRIANGAWPGNATCSNALTVLQTGTPPMLSGIAAVNKYNSPISTSCTSTTFSVDQDAVADWDGYIVNSLAATTIVNAATSQLRTTIGIPGSEPAMDSKLSRIATGNAELNRMRTTLLLGGNNINEVGTLNGTNAALTGTLTVAQTAAITGLLTANSGITANGVVNANSNLNVAGNTSTAGETTTGGWFRTNGDTGWYSNKWGGGWNMVDGVWIRAYNNKSVYTGGAIEAGYIQSDGNSYTAGRSTVGEFLQLNGVGIQGSPCAPNGLVGRDGAGKILSCASGVWASGSLPIKMYQCPRNYTTRPGLWATWGCIGQISAMSTCQNYAYDNQFYTLACTAIN
jgi:prepilin-type N-terminal cleavage/methylation domain-containing protein